MYIHCAKRYTCVCYLIFATTLCLNLGFAEAQSETKKLSASVYLRDNCKKHW